MAQGYDYYCRFIGRFPDVASLAEAGEDEVMKYWQGLGYYSRARNLHEAARSIHAAGSFPRSYKEVLKLKGVGEYTAAAICSFAYGLPHAVVDGNVYRVLSRWMGVDTPIDTTEGKKEFAALADALLDRDRPGAYNQAIMDFGALVCTAAAPRCEDCPLKDSCVAYAGKRVADLPCKARKTKVTDRFFNYFFIHTGDAAGCASGEREISGRTCMSFPCWKPAALTNWGNCCRCRPASLYGETGRWKRCHWWKPAASMCFLTAVFMHRALKSF